jgi:hypothetical protein
MARTARAPWKRANPRKRTGEASKHLSPAKKSAAKARALRAGRRYPNLVEPRGQHAHGSKEDLQEEGLEESFEIEILESKEDVREEDPQTHREEGQVSQAQRIRAREGSAAAA